VLSSHPVPGRLPDQVSWNMLKLSNQLLPTMVRSAPVPHSADPPEEPHANPKQAEHEDKKKKYRNDLSEHPDDRSHGCLPFRQRP